jgi:exopolysaccharide biosynthesis polyprenyl glycosylphosphotransferase
MSVFLPPPEARVIHQPVTRPAWKRSPRRMPERTRTGTVAGPAVQVKVAKPPARRWHQEYRRRVQIVDAIALVAMVSIAQLVIFTLLSDHARLPGWKDVTVLSTILVIAWLIALEVQKSRDILLAGAQEIGRVLSATMWLFVLITVADLFVDVPLSGGNSSIVIAMGLAGLVIGRHCVRRYLARRRKQGRYVTRVVIVGQADSARLICERFGRSAGEGYRVVGVCLPGFDGKVESEISTSTGAIPVLGDFSSVESAQVLAEVDALAVAGVEHLGHRRLTQLSWRMANLGIDMIVVPGLTDISRPRLTMQAIDNLPLFHIAPPRLDRASALGKRIFDVGFGTAALLVSLPVMMLVALAIKVDDGGPVIFRQERIGLHGNIFRIYKFRTMTLDADHRKESERAAAGHSGVFFKSACDSRITRVGRYLRAASLDELPQLFNVVGGAMSMVGPRPLVPGEGASVENFIERRGLVKPGITGLWQISGRSDAPDEERIRLDFSYVDNWSCVHDLMIVWQTVRVVLKRTGAY